MRRQLSIPTPAAQIAVCTELATNWSDYSAAFSASTLSLSAPTVGSLGRSVGPAMNFRDLPATRASRRSNRRFSVRSDVSQFYNSIYTHSIPWAVHGKSTAKQAFKNKISVIGDELDRHVRESQEGQTIGIPIGPDSSLVIAELVLSRIDVELATSGINVSSSSFRFMDDYELLCDTQDQAEHALGQLESLLTSFQLTLNPLKTELVLLPESLDTNWRTELHLFEIRTTASKVARADLVSFFSTAWMLHHDHPESAVLRYAIKKASSHIMDQASFDLFVDLALGTLVRDPSVLEVLHPTLLVGMANGMLSGSTLDRLVEGLVRICELHALRDHGNEVAWALWSLASLGLPLPDGASKVVARTQDDLVAALYLHMNDVGLVASHNVDLLDEIDQTDNAQRSSHWLLAYEATRRGWRTYSDVTTDQFCSAMLSAGVTFLQEPTVPIWLRRATVAADASSKREEWLSLVAAAQEHVAPEPAAPEPAAPEPAAPEPAEIQDEDELELTEDELDELLIELLGISMPFEGY